MISRHALSISLALALAFALMFASGAFLTDPWLRMESRPEARRVRTVPWRSLRGWRRMERDDA